MNLRRWSTPACRTARASMSPFGRSRLTDQWCRFGNSPSNRSTSTAWSTLARFAGPWEIHCEAASTRPYFADHLRRNRNRKDHASQRALATSFPSEERLITIEDAAELQLQQLHVGRLETRPPNIEGKGEIRQRDLVKNALRMRPDRIIIGECRGEEAFDMLQAMNTGHEGSMTTIHANSPRDALKRLEQMVAMAGMGLPIPSVRSQIASAITLIMQLQRLPDGRRRLISINEISGMEGDIIQMHEIFSFVKERTDASGNIVGHFAATGIRPQFLQELAPYGIELPAAHFDADRRL